MRGAHFCSDKCKVQNSFHCYSPWLQFLSMYVFLSSVLGAVTGLLGFIDP